MKRSMIAAILAAVVLAILATPAGAHSRSRRHRDCRYQTPVNRESHFHATARSMRKIKHGGWGP